MWLKFSWTMEDLTDIHDVSDDYQSSTAQYCLLEVGSVLFTLFVVNLCCLQLLTQSITIRYACFPNYMKSIVNVV